MAKKTTKKAAAKKTTTKKAAKKKVTKKATVKEGEGAMKTVAKTAWRWCVKNPISLCIAVIAVLLFALLITSEKAFNIIMIGLVGLAIVGALAGFVIYKGKRMEGARECYKAVDGFNDKSIKVICDVIATMAKYSWKAFIGVISPIFGKKAEEAAA